MQNPAKAGFLLCMKNKITIIKGDITKSVTDAIVNAANSSLLGGGGVDGAIHRAGGPAILEACRNIIAKQGGCKTGEAVITPAGNLPCRFVIHTVGPIWSGGNKNEANLLQDCYTNSLDLAVKNNCRTITFPNVSTGVYGFPKEWAANLSVDAINYFLDNNGEIDEVVLCCYDEENYNLLKSLIDNG